MQDPDAPTDEPWVHWVIYGIPAQRYVDAYHGTTYASVSIGGKPGDRVPGFDYIDDTIHHLSSPNLYRYGNGRTEQEFADDLVAEFAAKVAELGRIVAEVRDKRGSGPGKGANNTPSAKILSVAR